MQNEIDVQFVGHQVDSPWRVLAHGGAGTAIAAQVAGVDGLLLLGSFGEQQLDVVIAAQADKAR